MNDDIDLMQRWMLHPDTNRSAFEAMLADCMADAETIAVMKVLNVVLRDVTRAAECELGSRPCCDNSTQALGKMMRHV